MAFFNESLKAYQTETTDVWSHLLVDDNMSVASYNHKSVASYDFPFLGYLFFTSTKHHVILLVFIFWTLKNWLFLNIVSYFILLLVKALVAHFFFFNLLWPHVCKPPGASVYGITQARLLEWVPFPSQGIFQTQG